MAKIHIGKKIKEVVDKSGIPKTEFAKRINLTRDGVYKIFEKETIATDQLEKISQVLNHDFFGYYQSKLRVAHDKEPSYGFASKADVEELTQLVGMLAREMEKMNKEIALLTSSKTKKKSSKKK